MPYEQQTIAGKNSVREALRAGKPIDSLLVVRGQRGRDIGDIVAKCRDRSIPIKEVDARKMDMLCGGDTHQGIAVVVAEREYASMDDIFELAESKGEPPLLIVADGLEDPHNLGAIVRTVEACGAHGVIVPKRHSAGLTLSVSKAAAGALEYVPVVRVANTASALEDLKKRGVWIYAADMDGSSWCETDLTGPVALVLGSEGKGIGRLVKEKCDFVVSLPLRGHIESLNVSVAAGVLLYEAVRQRLKAGR